MSSVPTVDISGALAGDPGGMEAAASAVDAACVGSGFFVVVGHGVPSPSYRAVIETIPTTVTPERPARYEPVVAGEWIAAKSASMLEDDEDS